MPTIRVLEDDDGPTLDIALNDRDLEALRSAWANETSGLSVRDHPFAFVAVRIRLVRDGHDEDRVAGSRTPSAPPGSTRLCPPSFGRPFTQARERTRPDPFVSLFGEHRGIGCRRGGGVGAQHSATMRRMQQSVVWRVTEHTSTCGSCPHSSQSPKSSISAARRSASASQNPL